MVLSHKIAWDSFVNDYQQQLNNGDTWADGINPLVVIGSLIIKHIGDLSDRVMVQQIQECIYMQYCIGYSTFSDEKPFDPSLFVAFRKRLGIEQINAINKKNSSYGQSANRRGCCNAYGSAFATARNKCYGFYLQCKVVTIIAADDC